jgi:hypothetical protein
MKFRIEEAIEGEDIITSSLVAGVDAGYVRSIASIEGPRLSLV